MYVIGLEPVNQAVPESQGFAEVCARLLDPPANRTFADDVSFGVSVVATDGSAGQALTIISLYKANLIFSFQFGEEIMHFHKLFKC